MITRLSNLAMGYSGSQDSSLGLSSGPEMMRRVVDGRHQVLTKFLWNDYIFIVVQLFNLNILCQHIGTRQMVCIGCWLPDIWGANSESSSAWRSFGWIVIALNDMPSKLNHESYRGTIHVKVPSNATVGVADSSEMY